LFQFAMDSFASRRCARLFLAAVPDAGTAARIHLLASALKRAHRLDGRLVAPERLHISLFALGGLPEGQHCAAWETAMEVRTAPFEVAFDRTASLRGRPGHRPFVLVGDKGLHALQSFRETFCVALARKGMRRLATTNFTPHVTLLYDAGDVDEHPIEPIGWTVREFVLIRSSNGHEHLVRWPLWV
jgi:RNA 2',3'-cyclic 3'-phosphodiesterase